MKSYIPKIWAAEWCESFKLCTVRKNTDWDDVLSIKTASWEKSTEKLSNIINEETYQWLPIRRTYASWHVFLSDDCKEVFLVTIKKARRKQVQFTWWWPEEEELQDVVEKQWSVYRFDVNTVRKNARLRAKIRVWVDITDEYNTYPLVDRVLMEKYDEDTWERYRNLVCLMHFVVKDYTGTLWATGNEHSVDSGRYALDKLDSSEFIAPNIHLVTMKAVELLDTLQGE